MEILIILIGVVLSLIGFLDILSTKTDDAQSLIHGIKELTIGIGIIIIGFLI